MIDLLMYLPTPLLWLFERAAWWLLRAVLYYNAWAERRLERRLIRLAQAMQRERRCKCPHCCNIDLAVWDRVLHTEN